MASTQDTHIVLNGTPSLDDMSELSPSALQDLLESRTELGGLELFCAAFSAPERYTKRITAESSATRDR